MMMMTSSWFVSFLFFIAAYFFQSCQSCSFTCEDYATPCFDNDHEYTTPDCHGFLGCKNATQPCQGECPPELPILSKDGSTCIACIEDSDICPDCKEDQLWCAEEGVCKFKWDQCGGSCSSPKRPVLDPIDKGCYSCAAGNSWCQEEQRCYYPYEQPCNKNCSIWGMSFCEASGQCIWTGTPCIAEMEDESEEYDEEKEDEETLINIKSNKELCGDKVPIMVEAYDGVTYVFDGNKIYENGTLTSAWSGLPAKDLDAALTWESSDETYFFKGIKYWKFKGDQLENGYPKVISSWDGLPTNIEAAKEFGQNEGLDFILRLDKEGSKEETANWWFGCSNIIESNIWIPALLTKDIEH